VDLGITPSPQTRRMIGETRGPEGSDPIVVVTPRPARRGSRSRPLDSATANIIAQARHHWQQRTRSAVLRSIDYFSRAVERDARAVDAWSGLADAWVVMAGRGYAPVEDAAPRAAQYAERALSLDDNRSGAHASYGGVNIMRRQWDQVESALRRAIQIDPRNADARHWLAMTLLTAFGKRDEALREQTIAAQMQPLAPIQVGTVGWFRYLAGEFDLSKRAHEPAADLNDEVEEGYAGVARAAARLGDETGVRSAIAAGMSRRRESRGDLLAEYASALAVLGDTRRARRIVLEASTRDAAPMKMALAWASVGDANRMFSWLGRESFRVSWTPQAVWWDPRFDRFRDDARFGRVREAAAQSWRPDWM